jgi:hypothetical protein
MSPQSYKVIAIKCLLTISYMMKEEAKVIC